MATDTTTTERFARRSVNGTVVSFNADKTECTMKLQDGETDLGEGLFDTTKLNSILIGIADIESFMPVGSVLSAMIKSPGRKGGEKEGAAKEEGAAKGEEGAAKVEEGAKVEAGKEGEDAVKKPEEDVKKAADGLADEVSKLDLDDDSKVVEILRVRPLLGNKTMKLNTFPEKFTKVLNYDRRRYTVPGFGFSKQPLPGAAPAPPKEAEEGEENGEEVQVDAPAPKTCVPADLVAEVICELRKQISKWNGFPVRELLCVLGNRDEFSYIHKHFATDADLVTFLRAYPQYFAVTEPEEEGGSDASAAVFTMRGFKTQDLHDFLASEKMRKKPRRRDESYELIETIEHCREVVAELQDMVKRNSPLVLAIGCKGSKLRSGGTLTLLKIATMNGVAFIFDILATEGKENMFVEGGLKALLEDEGIVKVTYDCRTEQKSLYAQFDVVLRNVFDVSIAYTVISEQCHVTARTAPKFRSARPKFSELCSIFNCGKRPRNQRAFMETMNSTKDFWSIRPLTDEMLDFAIDDVLSLVPVIYRDLDRFISPLWWPLYENRVEDTLERSKVIDPEPEVTDGVTNGVTAEATSEVKDAPAVEATAAST